MLYFEAHINIFYETLELSVPQIQLTKTSIQLNQAV